MPNAKPGLTLRQFSAIFSTKMIDRIPISQSHNLQMSFPISNQLTIFTAHHPIFIHSSLIIYHSSFNLSPLKSTEILKRAHHLTTKPIPVPDAAKLEKAYADLRSKTQQSYLLNEKAKTLLPNGSQHTLPLTEPYPFFMHKGNGSSLTDVDGNTYVDYILSGGAIILGHNDPGLVGFITETITQKTHFHGHFDEMELKAAEEVIAFFPSIEKVRFTSSGSEANMAAVKIARAVTGKLKLIKFMGNYHGWGNEFLIDVEVPGSGKFISQGIPDAFMNETVLVPQNNLEALESAFKEYEKNGGVAAVICEPLGAESGLVPFTEDYHKQAIEMAHRYGALYIFDEVVTGFRLGKGGAQQLLGVMPDLSTLGKGLMNGFPSCGAVGGKKDIMDAANTSIPTKFPFTFIAGTLSGNALSMAACYHVVSTLRHSNLLDKAQATAADLSQKLNQLFESAGSDFFAYNLGNILRVELTAPHAVPITSQEAMMEVVQRRKILSDYALIVSSAGALSRMGRDFVSCAHTLADNNIYVAAYEKLLNSFHTNP